MDTTIRDDFAEFINGCDLFNSTVKIYTNSAKTTLKYDGKCIFDKKPNLVQNENGQVAYQGHKSILTLSMSQLTFMTAYSTVLNGYYAEVTDNVGMKAYTIVNSPFSSDVQSIYCELKEV
jgi:hypothetical protein